MSRIWAALLAAVLSPLALSAAPNLDPTAAAKARANEVQDFIFFGEKRPVLVRLHIQVNGKPFREGWNDFLSMVFKSYDRDGNEYLDELEARNVQPAQILLGGNFGGTGVLSMRVLDTNTDGKVSPAELAEYYRNNGGDVFNLQFIGSQATLADTLTKTIFDRLDVNRDGALSKDELSAAVKELYKLDSDDDENVSILELAPNTQLLIYGGYRPANSLPEDTMLYLIQPNRGYDRLAWHFLAHYGDPDTAIRRRKLRPQDIGLDRADFDKMDSNKDGVLDEDELPLFGTRSPDVEILLRLGTRAAKELMVELLSSKLPGAVRTTASSVTLQVGSTRLALGPPSATGNTVFPVGRQNLGQIYAQQLRAADRDNNGYLDKNEAQNSVFRGNLFALLDRNGDGLLFEKEVIDYFKQYEEIQQKGSSSRVNLVVSDMGNGLFDALDANRDGRLSLRELRNATQILDSLDRNKDGRLTREEIPRAFDLTLSTGYYQAFRQFPSQQFTGQQPRPRTQNGPLWYRAMDRNGDGDISTREFLGTPEEFKKLDLDGDGLISLDEAEKADKLAQTAK